MPYHVLAYTTGEGGVPVAGTPLLLSITGSQGNTTSSDQYDITSSGWPATDSTSSETLPEQWSMLIKRTGGGGFAGVSPYGFYGMRVPDHVYTTEGNTCDGANWTGGNGGPFGATWALLQFDQTPGNLIVRKWWGSTIPSTAGAPNRTDNIATTTPGTLFIRPYLTEANIKFAYGLYEWASDPF